MFNCDHCQKKYKRSWHQVRHSQMKHENSNASTTTTLSSAGTPEINESPTPEMNGNSNFTYQLQQVPQMPSQAPQDDNTMRYCQNQQQNANNFLGMNGTWDENNGTIQELHPANYRTDYCNNRFDQSGNTSASNYMESNAVHHDSWVSLTKLFSFPFMCIEIFDFLEFSTKRFLGISATTATTSATNVSSTYTTAFLQFRCKPSASRFL